MESLKEMIQQLEKDKQAPPQPDPGISVHDLRDELLSFADQLEK